MERSAACKTCHPIQLNLGRVQKLKETFDSKKNYDHFQEAVLNIDIAKENHKLSFNDLKHKFKEDYPHWKDIITTIPTALLLKYMKKIPYSVTESDLKKYHSRVFEDILNAKRKALASSKIKAGVEKCFTSYKKGEINLEHTSDLLNDNLLDIIFIGENSKTSCKKCEKKLKCPMKNCSVKKGFTSKLDVVRDYYKKHQWPCAISSATKSDDILRFSEQMIKENIKKYLTSTPLFSLMSSMKGQKTEYNLVHLLQSHLSTSATPGLLISNYKVFSSLKNLLKAFNINLSKSPSDNTQVEHDILSIIPEKDRVRVNFTQAKCTIQLPWPQQTDRTENMVSACLKAFEQVSRDLETFSELAIYFLTKEEFDKIDLNFNVSVTSLDGIPEEIICSKCRAYIFEEQKTYSAEKEKQVFGIHNLVSPTESSLEIFKTLATLYVGGGSIVELRNPKEGYTKEVKQMELVEKDMTKMFSNKDDEMCEKFIAHNRIIQLGPDQNNIYTSGIGVHQSYAVIAPWGGGKSMLLELELRRVVDLYNESKKPVKILIVVYEMKATDLLKHYSTIVEDFLKRRNMEIDVMTLKEICNEHNISYENRYRIVSS